MVIERLMKKMIVNPVPKKAFRPTTVLSISRHPMLTFGVSLEDVIERDKTEIPIVISDIFNFLLNKGGLQSEGIFRVNGNSRTVEMLRTIVDENGSYWHLGEFSSIAGDLDRSVDVFSVASLLKLYLRELPEGLIPENTTALFLKIHSEYRSNQDVYLIQLENLVAQLPVVNYTLLKHLCQFLHRVSVYQSDNKMSIESLGIVFGPNVFRFTPENLGYREQNSINHIMGILIEHSDSLFRMIAPSCENVTTLNDNLSDNNCTQIHHIPFNDVQAVRNKKYEDKFGYNTSDNLPSVKSRNNEDDGDTDNLIQSTTKVETNHQLTHVTNTYCDVPQIGINSSTTPPATTTTKAKKTVSELAKTNDIVDTNDNHFKRKSSTCDIISTYLEIAIRSCIQEHLFQERLSDFKVYDTADTVNNFNHISNQISKSDYSDVSVPKTISFSQANLKNPETNYSKLPSTTDRTNESNDRILNRLTYYLHNFKSRLREYEKLFEQDYGRKPTNSDKYSNPKIAELLRQLSEVQETIRQIKLSGKISDGIISPIIDQNGYSSVYNTYEDYSTKIPKNVTHSINNNIHNGNINEKLISSAYLINQSSGKQSFPKMDNEVNDYTRELRSSNNSFPSKPSIVPNNKFENENVPKQSDLNRPTIESTFLLLSKRLTEKRMIANRPEDLHLMTPKQIAAEKLALQKALLYFENLHGRPKEHQDRITMRPLYDRYRSVKRLLNCLQSDNNLNIAEHIEENSDTELQSSVPSIDDQMRQRSILSPNLVPLINDSNIQPKSIHSTGTTSNSITSFKSINPVAYSSLRSINRLYNPVSSIPDNNLPVPSMMSLSTSASFNLPICSSITSTKSTLGNNNDRINDRLDLTGKQPTVITSIPSTGRYNTNPNSTRLFSSNERPTYIDEKQNKNNFAFNKQSYNLDSNVDLKYNQMDCDAKRTSDRNSRVPCGNNNEWFGTIGLSKRNQDNAIHNYHVNTFNCHSQFVNETNQHPTSTHTSTRLFDSVTCSNRLRSEFSSPIRQENFIGARASYLSPPPLSSSFPNPKAIQANNSNEVQLGTNPTALMKNRRRFLDASENAINTVLSNDKCTDMSQAISSSDFSSWSTADLKTALRTLRESKRQLQKTLKDFEHEFIQNTGQKVEREDRLCMRSEYCEYKALKTRLFQLETELKGRCA